MDLLAILKGQRTIGKDRQNGTKQRVVKQKADLARGLFFVVNMANMGILRAIDNNRYKIYNINR